MDNDFCGEQIENVSESSPLDTTNQLNKNDHKSDNTVTNNDNITDPNITITIGFNDENSTSDTVLEQKPTDLTGTVPGNSTPLSSDKNVRRSPILKLSVKSNLTTDPVKITQNQLDTQDDDEFKRKQPEKRPRSVDSESDFAKEEIEQRRKQLESLIAANLSNLSIPPGPPDLSAFMCQPCGIRFSSNSTLLAHQTYYCSHR